MCSSAYDISNSNRQDDGPEEREGSNFEKTQLIRKSKRPSIIKKRDGANLSLPNAEAPYGQGFALDGVVDERSESSSGDQGTPRSSSKSVGEDVLAHD